MGKISNKIRVALFGLVASLMAVSCVPTLPPISNINDLQPNEILLVGKIELVPKLEEYDQKGLKGIGTGRLKNRINIVFSSKKPTYKKNDREGTTRKQIDNYAGIKPGETFFLRYPKGKSVYYLGGIIYLASHRGSIETMQLPGGLKFKPGKRSKAIYLGTIRYYRDDYNAITNVKVINQISQANREFRKKLGARFKLKRVPAQSFKMRRIEIY